MNPDITFGQLIILVGVITAIIGAFTGLSTWSQKKTQGVISSVTKHGEHDSEIKLLKYRIEQLTKEVGALQTYMQNSIDKIGGQLDRLMTRDD